MLAKEFKTIVLPLSNKLFRFALQFTKNEEEARDTIQDVFLKLWQKRNTLDGIENIEAFAMRMTRNKCLDLYRGKHTYSLEDQADSWQQKKKGDLNEMKSWSYQKQQRSSNASLESYQTCSDR